MPQGSPNNIRLAFQTVLPSLAAGLSAVGFLFMTNFLFAQSFVAFAGLIVWILGTTLFLFSGKIGIFGLGYRDLGSALGDNFEWKIAGLLAVAKLIAATASYSFDGCGSIFAPSLFIGGTSGYFLAALSVFAILVLVSLSTILQRFLFDNPYLIGRTGLFLIPLFTILLLFLFRELARGKAALKAVSISLLWIIACLGIYHFKERANTAMTVEWRSDADIKSPLEDLETRKNLDFPERSRISLGIDDIFYPSLAYYLKRGASAWLEVDTVPPYASYDFYYLEDAFESTRRILPQLILIKTYPLSGNLLTKLKDE